MVEYQAFTAKRKKKQLFAALIVLTILTGGWFWPLLGYLLPLCMILGIGTAIFKGRFWCNWLCPRGSFYDTMVKPLSPGKQIPALFKQNRFRIAILAILMLVLASNLISRWPDPYKIGAFFIRILTVTTVLGGILALFFHQRTWCYICPVGSLASWVGRKKAPLKIISKLCSECGLCSRVCPMQISPYKFKKQETETIAEGDCLKCSLCVFACPKRAITK